MLFSDGGKAVRFDENDVRPMGRNARGVRGMMLDDGQGVIAMLVAEDEQQSVLTATANGYGKRTSITEYTRHGRGTKGMIAIQQSERNGKVVAATLVHADDEIMLITDKGVLVRTRVSEIRELGRATQGVTLIGLDEGSKLSGLQRIVENDAQARRRRGRSRGQRRDAMKKDLAQLRTEIDAVDRELLDALNRRAALANEVGDLKRAEGSTVFRPEREAQVINGLQAANPGPLKDGNVATIWREIMSACRALEAPQRVAYLGPAGTFSEQAAVQFFGSSIEHVPCVNFDEVFHAATAGTADFGVVPVENNSEGVVTRSLDLLLHSPLHIVGEISLLVRHHLLRLSNSLDGIEVVLAHPAGAGAVPGLAEQAPAQGRAPRCVEQRRRRPAGSHQSGMGRHRRRTRRQRVRPAYRRPRHPGRRLQPHPLCGDLPAPDPGGAASLGSRLRQPGGLGSQQARGGARHPGAAQAARRLDDPLRVAARAHPASGNTISTSTCRAIPRSPTWPPRSKDLQSLCAFYKVLGTYPVGD